VEAYSKVISRRYGNQPFNNKNITAFIKKLAKEREAETCKSYRNALSSYAKWQKITNID
jgi:hypothetical protein